MKNTYIFANATFFFSTTMSCRGKLLVEAALFEIAKKRKTDAKKSASDNKIDAKTIRLDKDEAIPNEENVSNRKCPVRDGPASYKVWKRSKRKKIKESLSEKQRHYQTKIREEEKDDEWKDTGKEVQKDKVTENISNKKDEEISKLQCLCSARLEKM